MKRIPTFTVRASRLGRVFFEQAGLSGPVARRLARELDTDGAIVLMILGSLA